MRSYAAIVALVGLGAWVGTAYAVNPLPGSPFGLGQNGVVTIFDDSLGEPAEVNPIPVPLPFPVNPGFVILMENGGAAAAQVNWDGNHLLPPQDQWSDMIQFQGLPAQPTVDAIFMSWDAPPQTYPTPTTADQVAFLDEAVGPLETNPGVFTGYHAANNGWFIDYNIESSVPEPASLALLALGGMALLCRRRG